MPDGNMQDDKIIQEDLDRAQADLEVKVGQLKTAVMDKLETPRRVVSMVEKAIASVRSHPVAIACAIAVALLLVRARRARARAR
ncbi:MAG TPA: hypothetical protein VHN14_27555 [Kofleriaceae bacterium]|jgi:hypothetical protein|nr:hypothetical protein [Kofleriaceae bacterium]